MSLLYKIENAVNGGEALGIEAAAGEIDLISVFEINHDLHNRQRIDESRCDQTIVRADVFYRLVWFLDRAQELNQILTPLLPLATHPSAPPLKIRARSNGVWSAQAALTASRLILPREVRGIASTIHQRPGNLGSARCAFIHWCRARRAASSCLVSTTAIPTVCPYMASSRANVQTSLAYSKRSTTASTSAG